MPDIFDQVAGAQSAPPAGDIFDQVAAKAGKPELSTLLPTASDAVAIATENARQQAAALVNRMMPPMLPTMPWQMGKATPNFQQEGWTPEQEAKFEQDASQRRNPGDNFGPTFEGSMSAIQGAGQVATAPTLRGKAGGAAQMVEGGLEAATPAMVSGFAAAPVRAARTAVTFLLAQKGTQAALKSAGVPEEYARLAGDAAGVAAGGWTVKDLVMAGKRAMEPFTPGQRFGRPLEGEVVPPEKTPSSPNGGLGPAKEPIEATFTRSGPDIFDQVAKEAPGGAPQAQGDIFDQVVQSGTPEAGSVANKTGGEPEAVGKPGTPNALDEHLQQTAAGSEAQFSPEAKSLEVRAPGVEPVYGRDTSIAVPGEATRYPARYAVRELADVQASHNASSFAANPQYEHTNDRDYSQSGNAARVIKNAAPGTFDPEFLTTDSPTAEHGTPIIDPNGNALGGNSRAMTLSRVYGRGGDDAADYQAQIAGKGPNFGIDPEELARFKRPVLVRELTGSFEPQKAITDFNKSAAAELTPEERAVSDGRRMSPKTISAIGSRLDDLGEEGTLASSLRGDDGTEILQHLVKDGVITEQEKGGYLDDRGGLTPEAKARIGKALVGRLYDNPADFRATTPEMRAKLERVAPQILRVEGRQDWALTDKLREAVSLAQDARAHNMSAADQAAHDTIWKENKSYSPEAVQLAQTLDQSPVKAAAPFRRYANDEALSRPGAQKSMYEPPSQAEAFADAFDPGALTRAMGGSNVAKEEGSSAPGASNGQQQPAAAGENGRAGVSEKANGAGAGSEQAGPAVLARLPRELASATPRYAFGPKQFTVRFDSDVDRAAYITAQNTRSKSDAKYLKFAMDHTGLSESRVRAQGYQIRQALKVQAKRAQAGGELHVPAATVRDTGERGGVKLGELHDLAVEKLGLTEPRLNYSGLTGQVGTAKWPGAAKFGTGQLKSKISRNLSQLEEASPKAQQEGVSLAASPAQSSALMNAGVPAIEKALGTAKGGPKFVDLYRAYQESRLQGIRQRWGKMAAQASVSTPTQLAHMLDNGGMDLLKDIEEKGDVPQDVAQTAAALRLDADSGHVKAWGTMRDFLRKTFEQAAESVAQVMTPDEFDAVRYHPNFKAGDEAYGRHFENFLNESHARNEGVFSNALGPLNRYAPLVPIDKAQKLEQTVGMARPYKKPANIANHFATGLGEYDASMAGLRDRVTRAFRSNNKAAFIQTLEDEGLFQRFAGNERRPEAMIYNGVPFKAEAVETRGGTETVKGGKNEYLPAEGGIMPQWLAKEVEPLLDKPRLDEPGWAKRALSFGNRVGLSGPTELVMHSYALTGSLQVAMPFVGSDVMSYVGALPMAGKFEAIMRVIRTDPTTAESAMLIQEMAKLGAVPPAYGQETYFRKEAELTGAELHRTSFSPLLYGRSGVDIRVRLALYRMLKAAYPEATQAELRDSMTWLPNYTSALQGSIERFVKGTAIAPFYTAGSTKIRTGLHSIAGTGPMPEGVRGAKLLRWLTRGAGGVALLWMLGHKAYTAYRGLGKDGRGLWPWEDKKSQFLKVRMAPEDRHSKLGEKLWGHGPEDGYVNFAFFNPNVSTGTRVLGIDAAYNTWRAGGDGGQIREAAITQSLNTIAHPLLGPGARAAFALGSGDEAYLTGLRDREAKPRPQFMPASKEVSAAPHVGAAVRQMNSLYANIGSATGFGKLDPEYEPKGDRWLKMVTDLAVPQLVGAASNAKGRADFLKSQQAAERKITAKRRSEENRKRAGQ